MLSRNLRERVKKMALPLSVGLRLFFVGEVGTRVPVSLQVRCDGGSSSRKSTPFCDEGRGGGGGHACTQKGSRNSYKSCDREIALF